jgi:hypothetical protein
MTYSFKTIKVQILQNKLSVETNSVQNTSISYSDTGKVPLLSASVSRKPKHVILHSDFSQKNRVITIDLLGHGAECLGYVHSMEDNADAQFISRLRIHEINSRWSFDGLLCGGFRRIVPEYKGLVC